MHSHLASVYSIKMKLNVSQKIASLGKRDSMKGSDLRNIGYLRAGYRLIFIVKLQGPPWPTQLIGRWVSPGTRIFI